MDENILIVLVCLVFSAFFSGTEIAFLSANRLHIAIQEQKGVFTGKIIASFLEKPSLFIATTLIGNTTALVLYGAYMTEILNEPIEGWLLGLFGRFAESTLNASVLIIQTIISTLIVLLTAEFLPKSISLINPDVFIRFAAIPMRVIYVLSYPVIFTVVHASNFLIKNVFGIDEAERKHAFGLSDLNNYVINTQNDKEEDTHDVDKQIFSNALEFKKVKVRDCLVPRKEIVAVELEDDISHLQEVFVESGHSKVPVFKETIDNIVGYCHLFHMFRKPTDIKSIMSDLIIVPETMLANELMIKFISSHKSMALVVDEFGGTSGIVTIEDIMEEIFGEIEDEYDEDDLICDQLDDNLYKISARHEIGYLNEACNFIIPEGDYDTLGGYILDAHKDIPKEREVIEVDGLRIEVVSMSGARIDTVKVEVGKQEEDSSN